MQPSVPDARLIISSWSSGMHRKQNFKIEFGFISDTGVLTFTFHFLSSPLFRQVQKSDRINSDRQSGSDQLGSTQTDSDRIKK